MYNQINNIYICYIYMNNSPREIYDESLQKNNTYIYIIETDTATTNKILQREYILNIFLENMNKYFTEFVSDAQHKIKTRFSEYIFMEKGLPKFENMYNLNHFEKTYNVVTSIIENVPVFKVFVDKMKEIISLINEKHNTSCIKYVISNNKINKYHLKIKQKHLHHRYALGYNVTTDEMCNVNFSYYNVIKYLVEGNQWAMYDDLIDYLKVNGYKIEVFGSPFNTRLEFFGSLYPETDTPFGSLGNYDYILQQLIDKKPLYWRDTLVFSKTDVVKIQIGPPCVFDVVLNVWKLIQKLMDVRPAMIHFGTPNVYFYDEILNYKYLKSVEYPTKFISYEHNKIIQFNVEAYGRVKTWYYYILSNID
jgi:hypothetical protein